MHDAKSLCEDCRHKSVCRRYYEITRSSQCGTFAKTGEDLTFVSVTECELFDSVVTLG